MLTVSIHYQLNFKTMKKHILLAAGAVLVVAAVSVFVYVKNERNSMDELFNANVEALAQQETGLSILCDNYSYVIVCKYTCVCGRTWTTNSGYGYSKGLSGKCSCGRTY